MLILEALGYHRDPFDRPWIFISDGTVQGPKGLGLEPLDDEALISVEMFHYWLMEIGIDAVEVRRVLREQLADHP